MASERSAAAVGEEVRRAEGFDPAASTGLFVGVSAFEYGEIDDVPYAVDDAVDLAHLFSFELGLVRPSRAVLALAGEPKKPGSRERLAGLLAQGARRVPARRSDLYYHLRAVTRASGPEGLFVLAVATHGLSDRARDLILASDALLDLQVTTGVAVSDLFFEVANAGSPRRLVLLDACRDPKADDRELVGRRSGAGASPSFAEAIARAEGQAVLSATNLGGYSYDDPEAGNGVFTAAVLDGLRGAAPVDERGFITAGTLAGYLQDRVAAWVRRHASEDREWSRGVETKVEGPAAALPLARDPERESRLQRYRERRAAALSLLLRLSGVSLLNETLFDQIRDLLPVAGPTKDSEKLLAEIEALESGGERAQRSLRDLVRELRGEGGVEAIPQASERREAAPPGPGRQAEPVAPTPTPKRLGRAKEKGGEAGRQGVAGAAGAPSTAGGGQSAREGGRRPPVTPTGPRRWPRWVKIAAAAVAGLALWWGLQSFPATADPEPENPTVGTLWRAHLGLPLRFVPAGTYSIGSPEGEPGQDDDETRHPVRLTRGFWIGETEVTQAQWGELVAKNPSTFKACGGDCPVENVNWFEAAEFANRVSNRAGLALCYRLTDCTGTVGGGDFKCADASFAGLDCPGYRLPTEAEWEVAARAGTESAIYRPELKQIAWYAENSVEQTHPVGKKDPNDWGLRDPLGNVWEWTSDWWDATHSTYPGDDPTGPPTGLKRVFRGGSWLNDASSVRAAYRDAVVPEVHRANHGFRLTRGQGRSSQ